MSDPTRALLYNFTTGIIDGFSGTLRLGNGSASVPSFSFGSDINTGMYRGGIDVVGFACGGLTVLNIAPDSVESLVRYLGPDGSASEPAYTFSSNSETGMFLSGSSDELGFCTNGTIRFNISDTQITASIPVILPSFTVAGVPAASGKTGGMIYVTNETGGAVPAFSDGTNWRRVTDRAIIS